MMKRKLHSPDIPQREALLHQIERITELPLLILSFAMIPLLVGPFFWHLSPEEESVFVALDVFVWALFAVDLIIKIVVTPKRLPYIKRHWLEVLVVVVPFFRPLRILRIFLFGSRAWVGARRLVNIDFLLVYGIGLVIISATIVATVEGGEGASIHSFTDALWWAVVTITTVGYGDMVPVTVAGRAIAFVLMLGGIAFFSGVTANLASFLVKGSDDSDDKILKLADEIKELKQEIAKLRQNKQD
ncbi:MAG TPA: potassium channel family protein [Dehalococcoidia bacterium]|nr:potassium channel family protein [Dehalococcoidia bacterium]